MFSGLYPREFVEAAAGLIYPPHCAACEKPLLRRGAVLCRPCAHARTRLTGPRCGVCGQPFGGAVTDDFRCMNCGGLEMGFEFATSAYRCRGVVRDLLHHFKYHRRLHMRHLLARMLCEGMRDPRVVRAGVDAIVPVPLHPAKLRHREFNQAEVLARLAGQRLRLPVVDCLRRSRFTQTQTHFHREERLRNLRNAFTVKSAADLDGKCVALVDDVLTTGSTADACARALRDAGAAAVVVITVARG